MKTSNFSSRTENVIYLICTIVGFLFIVNLLAPLAPVVFSFDHSGTFQWMFTGALYVFFFYLLYYFGKRIIHPVAYRETTAEARPINTAPAGPQITTAFEGIQNFEGKKAPVGNRFRNTIIVIILILLGGLLFLSREEDGAMRYKLLHVGIFVFVSTILFLASVRRRRFYKTDPWGNLYYKSFGDMAGESAFFFFMFAISAVLLFASLIAMYVGIIWTGTYFDASGFHWADLPRTS
ncbi:hypothetical protein [Chitinophaga barathri]|uniref:Uncharacterized protein n=1 Tax=Chitinophaga barathri TaxID=1647451 RepID=A0A3N4MHN4_9BACT|nr:hypothetical protein [Chitinophaga barathri]RPD42935.1 hypothetical protein EG028_01170 [Chitinophaga barathri]